MTNNLAEISAFIDAVLDINNVSDWANALNGLQLANSGSVTSLGAAVDAGEQTVEKAASAGIDLLLVHHGLFWSGLRPITGAFYRKMALAMRADMAVYSAHLPLDCHPEFGNNALLARALGLEKTEPFFFEKGRMIGVKAVLEESSCVAVDDLEKRLVNAVAGPVKVIRGGSDTARAIGIVTGGAGGEIHRAAAEGVDTFITGEAPHWAAVAAQELGVNLMLAGHYATETFGVKALAAHLGKKFGLPWQFIDHPTGL